MNRREFLAGGTTVGVTVGMAGCLSRLPFVGGESGGDGDDSEEDTETGEDDEDAGEATDENSTEDDPTDTNENETTENETEGDQNESDENETEYAEAQDPETNPDNAPNETEYADPEEVQAGQPTAEDVTISNTAVTKAANGEQTTVTGTLTNESGDTLGTIDVEVTFHLEDGSTTTAMWGTNDLADGESWDFEVTGDVPYASVAKCDIRPVF